jgi:hypothetical protein
MPIYVPGKVVMAQTYVGIDDPDAAVYVAAVEAADGQSLETATRVAIHSFVKGCKNDGIWPAIKASCILSGARTLAGALVPLVGTAPTNVGGLFVSGDYNRKTGLVGDGSTKYLDSNRAGNTDPQNNCHLATYISTVSGSNFQIGNGASTGRSNIAAGSVRSRNATVTTLVLSANNAIANPIASNSFSGISRSSSANFVARANADSNTYTVVSEASATENYFIFASNNAGSALFPGAHRLAFYSIGESLNLALLDARVTTLINAFAAAIP